MQLFAEFDITPPVIILPYMAPLLSVSASAVLKTSTGEPSELELVQSPIQSILLNPDFIEPVGVAVDEDSKYKSIYDEYAQTGKVHPLAAENEWLCHSRSHNPDSAPILPAAHPHPAKKTIPTSM